MAAQTIIHRGIDWFHSRIFRQPMRGTAHGSADTPMRLLIVANALIPTVQLSLIYPIAARLDGDKCSIDLLTEHDMKQKFGKKLRSVEAATWISSQILSKSPTHIVFCRYSGPHYEEILAIAASQCIPTVYCIDDDLLNVPPELGKQKYDYHNHPLRIGAVRYLLDNVDLIYCSNTRLGQRLREIGIAGHLRAGQIFCAGELISPVELRPVQTLGYMGFDHARDFEVALPGLVKVMHRFPYLRFELFGKIPKPAALDIFGDRIEVLPVVPDYEEYLKVLATRRWDIGICPLMPTDFNRVKNVNKWIEYTAVGAAVVATKGMIYDECCANGCGLLVGTSEWEVALTTLVTDPQYRFEQVRAAQRSLIMNFSVERLCEQVLEMLNQAKIHSEQEKSMCRLT